jgi:hypothetical protein
MTPQVWAEVQDSTQPDPQDCEQSSMLVQLELQPFSQTVPQWCML